MLSADKTPAPARVALWMIGAAISIVITFGRQSSAIAQWWLGDAYAVT